MKPKTNGNIQRTQRLNCAQGDGPNWVLIAGGALLSTLSIRIGCRLKQAFDAKRSNKTHHTLKENGNCAAQRRPGTCKLHSNLYSYMPEDGCYHCVSGNLNGAMNATRPPTSPISKDGDPSLPLVKVPTPGSSKDTNGVMWASSPDCLEHPRKPFLRSNSLSSPSSESGSDIYSKRQGIQKLRQQLKRRDEMIMEMQNSLGAQMARSAHLQAQLDAANRDLFDSEREIRRLRKAVADHCVAEAINAGAIGYLNGIDDVELRCVGADRGRGESDKIEMLKREVGELKEVIGGKEFLLHSYKEQKVELSAKVQELEQKLASQIPNIL